MLLKKTALTSIAIAIGLPFLPTQVPVIGIGQAKAQLFCSNDGKRFNEWKAAFKKQYAGKYKASTLKKLDAVGYDAGIIRSDRNNKKSFKGTFESFYARRSKGVKSIGLKRYRSLKPYFDRAEQKYGVPAGLLIAIWGLETGFGRFQGDKNILQSIATLAYDCRRSKSLFFPEMLAAMEIIDRGLIDLSKKRGAWAGEIGQTQLLATRFLLGATDFDGGGINVFNSSPDAIGTTANWFAKRGWRRGQGFQPGTSNYRLIQEWNRSDNYQLTIAVLGKDIDEAL